MSSSFNNDIKEIELMLGLEQVNKDEPLDDNQKWLDYMNNETPKTHGRSRMKRFTTKLIEGRGVKPCGRECPAWGNAIIMSGNHKSMFYSKLLTNDRYYLVQAARITPVPAECQNFFYHYVNQYLKDNAEFRLEFLKSLFLNDNILTRKELEWFIDNFGFQTEYEIIKNDIAFQEVVKETFRAFYDLSNNAMNNMAIKTKKAKKLVERNITRMNNEYTRRLNSLLSCFKREKLYGSEASEIFANDAVLTDPTIVKI